MLLIRFQKEGAYFDASNCTIYTIYLNGDLYVVRKKIGKCYFFANLCVCDIIPVDSIFNTNFTFREFCGGKISEWTSKLS